jgi:DNA-directed RNA polymerase specialized sigma24 family protein
MVPENPSLSHELPLHAVWVRRLARRLVRDESTADDLSQEVALAALRAREPEPRGPWVARVASNLAARAFRTRASRERVERAAARGESVPALATWPRASSSSSCS